MSRQEVGLLIAVAFLGGCATASPPPIVTAPVPPIRVEVPVPVACVTEIPPLPARTPVDPDAAIQQTAAAAAADVHHLEDHVRELRALLLACKEVKP